MIREEEEGINLDLAQVKEALTRGLTGADPTRAAGLATILHLTEARDAGLQREHLRLSKVLPAEDPRLTAIAVKLETSRELGVRVAFEAKRADGGLGKADPKVWTLQGFVFVKDESWLQDKAVALFDRSGAIIADTETDLDQNKFVIRHQVPVSDATDTVTPAVLVGVVGVNGRRKRLAFLDPRPLSPQNGRMTYVEVNIGVPPKSERSGPRPRPTQPVRRRPDPKDPNRPRRLPDRGSTAAPGAAGKRRVAGRRPPSSDQKPPA